MVSGHFDRTAAAPRNGLATRILLVVALVLGLVAWPALAAPAFPKLTGRVTDAAGILPADTVATLEARLAALETSTTTQLVVATVPDLEGNDIADYANQLFRTWGVGQKATNNGVLLLVAPNERKVRIEVGYGQEGTLTDALTSQIIRRNIIPYFKAGDMAGGVTAGTEALVTLLELPTDQQAQAAAAAAQARPSGDGRGIPIGTIVWMVIILIWLVVSASRRRRGLSSGPVILWGPG
ncbi:MAG: methanol dehydrogenase, partial [Alphaproteobacteria bacterium]